MTARQVEILQKDASPRLPETLSLAARFTGLEEWLNFVHKMYGFPVYRLASRAAGGMTGWLTLVHVRHSIFGNYLATSPFGSYGGFAYASVEIRDALLEEARALAKELGVEYVNVRFDAGDETPPKGWVQHPIYSTYLVDLPPNPESLLSGFGSDHRNHVRKSLKKGFTVKFGHLDLLDDTYEALARSMHELGSPYHDKNYLREMAQALGEALEFVTLYGPRRELAGAGAFIAQGDMVTNLHANILRRFRSEYAGEFLYWSVIARYCEQGFKVLDLGRSLNGSGNEIFKMKWKPRKIPLAYWHYLPKGGPIPELNQKSPKFRFAIWLWQRLPALVVRALGPSLIRGIV